MNTSPKLKIIVVGSALIVLLVAFRFIPERKAAPSFTTVSNINFTDSRPSRVFKQFNQPAMEQDHIPSNQTVSITYDLRGPNEAKLIDRMNMTLLELGLQKDERTVRQLVLARINGDWSTTPPGPDWRDNAMWQKHAADMLKRKVGYLLPSGTNYVVEDGRTNMVLVPADALTIKRVLECDMGVTVPPMEDFEVHEN